MNTNDKLTALGKVADSYLHDLEDVPTATREEISKFVRWFGKQLTIAQITPSDINDYAESIASQRGDTSKRLLPLQLFLQNLHTQRITTNNLATHLKPKKRPNRSRQNSSQPKMNDPNVIQLTVQGQSDLQERLTWLQEEIVRNSTAIKKAAADKDVRENAPLAAAREYQGQLEGRIREIQATLAIAEVIKPEQSAKGKVNQGNSVTIQEELSGKNLTWILVDPREAEPLSGKLSIASPVGSAILGQKEGTQVRVSTPSGHLTYRIIKIV